METKTKIAIGLGAIAAILLFANRGGIMNGITILGQNYGPGPNGRKIREPWAFSLLGNGQNNFASAACVFMSILMAYNAFNKNDPEAQLDPLTANNFLKKAGAFLPGSSALDSQKAANALGISMPDAERVLDTGGLSPLKLATMKNIINNALSRGGLVLFRVDHNRDLKLIGDHSILIFGKSGGNFLAADPALAEVITIDANTLVGAAGASWGDHIPYQGVAASAMYAVV